MNREPTALLIPLRDVLAWIPTLSRKLLYKWEAMGLIHPVRYSRKGYRGRKGEIGNRYYRTLEIAKICGTNGNAQVKGRKSKK